MNSPIISSTYRSVSRSVHKLVQFARDITPLDSTSYSPFQIILCTFTSMFKLDGISFKTYDILRRLRFVYFVPFSGMPTSAVCLLNMDSTRSHIDEITLNDDDDFTCAWLSRKKRTRKEEKNCDRIRII